MFSADPERRSVSSKWTSQMGRLFWLLGCFVAGGLVRFYFSLSCLSPFLFFLLLYKTRVIIAYHIPQK